MQLEFDDLPGATSADYLSEAAKVGSQLFKVKQLAGI